MRYTVIIITIALSLLLIPFNFTYSEVTVDSNFVDLELETIFLNRAAIWNKFVLGGYETMELLEEDLNENAVEPLIKTDLKIFNEIQLNPTSYELIEDVTIDRFDIISIDNKRAKGIAKMNWVMQGLQRSYIENIEYTVYLVKVNGKWMLSDYHTN